MRPAAAIHRRAAVLAVLACAAAPVQAQQPAPPGMPLAAAAARRFPQPVRVGDLVGRRVLLPLESQPTVGRVRAVVRQADGRVDVVMGTGGVLGFFARPVAVPVEAMVLLGPYMEVMDLTPAQLGQLATFRETAFRDAGAMRLPDAEVIRVGLARPSH